MARTEICQVLRCDRPAAEPFNAGTSAEPLIYWLCEAHREEIRTSRWSAQTHGVMLLGADALLETPKQVRRFNVRASNWQQVGDEDGAQAFVELEMTLGYAEGPEHDEDLTILIPTDVADILANVLPGLAADARRKGGETQG